MMRKAIEKTRNGTRDCLTLLWALVAKVLLSFMRAEPRTIKDVPSGFNEEDIKMANQKALWNQAKITEFLAPSPQNQERIYQIGIAFVGGRHSSVRCGHAEIVVRDGDGLSEISPPTYLDLTVSPSNLDSEELLRSGPCELAAASNIRLRVLHLRNAIDGSDSLELEFKKRTGVRPYKYIDLYRIHATERRLKHLALRSCSEEYNILVDDCATFCQEFLNRLLDHLLDLGKRNGGIDRDQHKYQRQILGQLIHIEDGLAGEAERGAA
ncbi:hypothetical protein GGS24DRAFT_248704 [Hypoxylon argillaceum]|nr:hypothetical protein GGS24DRAFT_248704 [Hypoxylon argillaceum]